MANYTPQRLVHVTGIAGLSTVLNELPREVRTAILAEAVTRGADPLVISAKSYARRSIRTGALYLAIGKRVKKYESSATAVAVVGIEKGYFKDREKISKGGDRSGAESPSHYAHLIEFGHHVVTGGSLRSEYRLSLVPTGELSVNGKAIKRWKRSGIKTPAKGKKTAWVAARPFMRPAFAKSKGAVQSALQKGISDGVEKTRRRLVNQGAHQV